MIRVLFVCLGNICRSPTAQGVFERLVAEHGLSDFIAVDSAGTGNWHAGEPPDPRAIRAAGRRGIDLSRQRARQVEQRDLEAFDYVLAMDRDNLKALHGMTSNGAHKHVGLLLDFAPHLALKDVPDPYYGGPQGFEHVLDLIEVVSAALFDEIRTQYPTLRAR